MKTEKWGRVEYTPETVADERTARALSKQTKCRVRWVDKNGDVHFVQPTVGVVRSLQPGPSGPALR
jgi:hypothetical protein